jgi:uncharacterized membrane protein YbaN (DUF454 family)
MTHRIRIVLGFVLIAMGVLGLLLPLMPGIPLLLAGVALVGVDHPWIKPVKERFLSLRRKWTLRTRRK